MADRKLNVVLVYRVLATTTPGEVVIDMEHMVCKKLHEENP